MWRYFGTEITYDNPEKYVVSIVEEKRFSSSECVLCAAVASWTVLGTAAYTQRSHYECGHNLVCPSERRNEERYLITDCRACTAAVVHVDPQRAGGMNRVDGA